MTCTIHALTHFEGVLSFIHWTKTSSFMTVRLDWRDGHTAVVATGLRESKSRRMGKSTHDLRVHFDPLIHNRHRGHVWYAVDPDNLTEKVGNFESANTCP